MSAWLRSAVHKAVLAGNKNKLSRIRTVADSVVLHAGQAVAGSAKLLQDHIGPRNGQSSRHTMKRLEEVSISCRGEERILLLRRWLVALKQIEKISTGTSDDKAKESEQDDSVNESEQPSLVLYYDQDHGGEPLNFRDVFLRSQALEGIVMSMILEAPNDEEVALLLEIFGLCLLEGKEVHNTTVSNIKNLAKVFSSYHDEVLMKREELLQYAQNAMTGLKMNVDLARIDVEVSSVKKKLNQMETQLPTGEDDDKLSKETAVGTVEALKEALGQIQLCSKLESLLLEKRSVCHGDSPGTHAQKVDKMKVLLESLVNSTSKAERRIADHRSHKEEALSFRLAKASEVSQVEKDLVGEIHALERQKDDLEMELKKVNTSLTAAKARLRNAREERDQFDEASNEILQHLQTREEELSKSIASCKVEADVVTTWIKFVENAWGMQSAFTKQKEKHVSDELERNEKYHVDLILRHLPAYKIESDNSVNHFRELVQKLQSKEGSGTIPGVDNEDPTTKTRKTFEEEYLDLEAKLIATFGLVESIRQTHTQSEDLSRKTDPRIKGLFDSLKRIKEEFESIERPMLRIQTPTYSSKWRGTLQKLSTLSPKGTPKKQQRSQNEPSKSLVIDGQKLLEPDSEVATPDSSGKRSRGLSADEIDWEFDALES